MRSSVETLSPTRVRLEIEVPFVELEPSVKKAYRDIASQVTVPGFRRGKVPAAVIDQRVGRGAVLNEAVQDAIPQHIVAAVREHEVRSLGRPDVEIKEFSDGQPLKFTAELDVRPKLTLPDLATVAVTIDELQVDETEIDDQVRVLRDRFGSLKTVERAAQVGDYVQLDLAATIDGQPVPGGSAVNISHEVGSNQLMPGLDEAIAGRSAGETTTFDSELVGGDLAGKQASVEVAVRTVKEKELPPLDDDFAQLASEFDTLSELRDDLRERLTRVKRLGQLYTARDKALAHLVTLAEVPAPDGLVRDEVDHRKQEMADELERIGSSMADYLTVEGRTEQEIDTELAESASEGIKIQLVLDAIAEQESIDVSDDEFGHEIVHRAQRIGMSPQAYYDRLVRDGAAAAVYSDVRRGKALSKVLELVKITDSTGAELSLAELRGAEGNDEPDEHHPAAAALGTETSDH